MKDKNAVQQKVEELISRVSQYSVIDVKIESTIGTSVVGKVVSEKGVFSFTVELEHNCFCIQLNYDIKVTQEDIQWWMSMMEKNVE